MPQWISILNLALELPFNSNEEAIWSKLLAEHSKFGDVFISTLLTIDLVRIPFIDYSFVRYFCKKNLSERNNQEKIFLLIQNEIQIFLNQRILAELLALLESDREELKKNLLKLKDKVSQLADLESNKTLLKGILKFLENLREEIKELERNKGDQDLDQEN